METTEKKQQKKRKQSKPGERLYSFAPKTPEEWRALKLEFLASTSESLREFVRVKHGESESVEAWSHSGNFARRTEGWTEERQKHIDAIERRAIENAKKKAVAEYAIDVADLLKMKKTAIDLVRIAMSIHQQGAVIKNKDGTVSINPKGKAPSMRELEKAHKMIRLELGETTEKNEMVGENGAPLVQAPPVVNINIVKPTDNG